MEKVKNGKNLKEKVLFLMCLGVLAGNMSAGVYAQQNPENNIKDYSGVIKEKYDNNEYTAENEDGKVIKTITFSEDNEVNEGIYVKGLEEGTENEPININLSFNNKVKVNNSDIKVESASGCYENITMQFNKELFIDNKNGYALYSHSSTSGGGVTTSIKIGDEKNNKNIVKIIGDLGTHSEISGGGDGTKATSKIELNLNNSESYFAGRMETGERKSIEKSTTEASIKLNLKNKATWYAHFNESDIYKIDGSYGEFQLVEGYSVRKNDGIEVKSNGGIIDIYNYTPNNTRIECLIDGCKQEVESLKIELNEILNLNKDKIINIIAEKNPNMDEKDILKKLDDELSKFQGKDIEEKIEDLKNKVSILINAKIDKIGTGIIEIKKKNFGTRTFTLNGVGDRLQNTTFRISTDVENKKSDKIVLNDVKVNKDEETYYIQIAADPFKGKEWKADKDDKILVMDIENKGTGQIEVIGEEYTTEIGAGLVKQTITPTVEEDSNNKGDWYLTAIEKVENTAGNKGSGHIFAEIGAAANAGMAAAWRADSSDIYQRMGNLRNNEAEQGVWGRIYTGENEVRKGIDLDLEYRAVQVGYDRKEKIDEGKLFTGIAFGYFDGNADYDHGSGESNSATVGLYATYLGANGSFGDFIIKYGNLDNELSYTSESGDSYKADYDTYGFSADAEYGYHYMFDNDYYIEPLAQLSYVYIDDEDYTMNLNGKSGARVSNDSYQSLIGYAGFHYGKKFDDNVAYLRVAAAHEFMGDIDINAKYQDIKVNSSISGEDTWVEYGVGFDAKVKEDTAVYGRLQRSTGDVIRNKWHVSLGIRYTF